MITINFANGNDVVFSVPLDDVKYKIRMMWNHEGQFWTLHLWDANDNVILANVRVVPKFPLLMNHHVKNVPRGEFIVLTEKEDVGRDDFQSGAATLVYCTEDEFYGG